MMCTFLIATLPLHSTCLWRKGTNPRRRCQPENICGGGLLLDVAVSQMGRENGSVPFPKGGWNGPMVSKKSPLEVQEMFVTQVYNNNNSPLKGNVRDLPVQPPHPWRLNHPMAFTQGPPAARCFQAWRFFDVLFSLREGEEAARKPWWIHGMNGIFQLLIPMTDPWKWYIYLHECLIFYSKFCREIYTSPMRFYGTGWNGWRMMLVGCWDFLALNNGYVWNVWTCLLIFVFFLYRWAKHVEGYEFKHHVGNNKEYFYHRTRVIHWISHLVGWNSIGFPPRTARTMPFAAGMACCPRQTWWTFHSLATSPSCRRSTWRKMDFVTWSLKFDTRDRGFDESRDTQQRVKDT